MITELEQKAYGDIVNRFWNPEKGNFSFSKIESVSSPSITTACLLGIQNYGEEGEKWIKKNSLKIEEYYLEDYPWMDAGKHYKNVMAMSFGLVGLSVLSTKENTKVPEGIEYLKEQQNDDGGWHFNSAYSEFSHPYFTYWALRALLANQIDAHTYEEVILPALNFMVRNIPMFKTHATTYLMIRHAIKLVSEECEIYMNDDLKESLSKLHIYKLYRFQLANGTWKPEPAVISSAYFRKSIFTLKCLYFLSELEDKLISDQFQKMLNWIEANYLDPGWPSDADSSPIGVSWTTAYLLLGLSSYKIALKTYLND